MYWILWITLHNGHFLHLDRQSFQWHYATKATFGKLWFQYTIFDDVVYQMVTGEFVYIRTISSLRISLQIQLFLFSCIIRLYYSDANRFISADLCLKLRLLSTQQHGALLKYFQMCVLLRNTRNGSGAAWSSKLGSNKLFSQLQ